LPVSGSSSTQSLTTVQPTLTGVTVQSIALSNVDLFAGVNGDFVRDSVTGDVIVDSNGHASLDTSKATGFSVTGANLDLVKGSETTGQLRSWSAVVAHVGAMTVEGLPDQSLTLEVQSLDLLYNGADKTTGSKLDWAGITGADFVLSDTVSAP